jgi:hypothetical protein
LLDRSPPETLRKDRNCVANALHFLSERVSETSSWLPSFEIRNPTGDQFEADYGMLAAPNRFSHRSSPHLILGECKSFNRFEPKDFARARKQQARSRGRSCAFVHLMTNSTKERFEN